MRTPEEILKSNGLQIGFKSTYSWDEIVKSMKEYAIEYHTEQLNKPYVSNNEVAVCPYCHEDGGIKTDNDDDYEYICKYCDTVWAK